MKKNVDEKATVKAPFFKRRWFYVVVALAVVLLALYLGFSVYFQSHFCFGTTINGISAGGKSANKVEELISNEVKGYSLTLLERGEQTEEIEGEQVALVPDFSGEVENLLEEQNGFAWIIESCKKSVYTLETMLSYDEDALKMVVEELSCMQAENQEEPVNAYVDDYDEKDGFAVVPAVQGTKIEEDVLMAAIEDAILNLATELDLDEAECYVKPELDEEDPDFQELVSILNGYAEVTITYDVGNEKEVLDGSITNQWLSISDDMEVSVDEEAVSEYVSGLASTYNTVGKAKSLDTSYGQTITISNSRYGWKVDNEGETEQILADLAAGEDVEREPVYSQTANSHGTNDYGDSYVEINLTAQHLFLFKNGQLIIETDFVSGSLASGNQTPTGAFGVTYTEKDATLKGTNANGSSYATPVSYWMPFFGNYGMHDASWRGDFGGSIYKRSGSHGCVNLPVSAAKTIFENVAAGYPVLVYELAGTESAKGIAQDQAYEVTKVINTIGTVTLDSAGVIGAARAQYDALSEEAKAYVKNYDTLAAAEIVLSQLQAVAAQQAADQQAAEAQKAAQERAKQEAQPVITLINNIGTVTYDDACKMKIDTAESAYSALSDTAKSYVTNYAILTAAKNQYELLMNASNS